MRTVLKEMVIIILFLLINSCKKDSHGPVIEIYKFKGDYANLVPVLMSGDDSTKIIGFPQYDNDYYQKPIKFHKGYYALGTDGIRTAYLSLTWDEYKLFGKQPGPDSLGKLIFEKHPFLEYWEDENEVLTSQYLEFDTAKLNQIIDSNEMSRYFRRIK